MSIHYIYIESFSRCFYPKPLTNEDNKKQSKPTKDIINKIWYNKNKIREASVRFIKDNKELVNE